jgi:16S rRNA (adenine1518-N6/adenine1519-N6)-dimethyltransferase
MTNKTIMPTRLGQNFLKDKSIIKKIIESADLQPDDFVIEVGPGEGVLTEELAKYVKKVIAIEIDGNLVQKLQKKFENRPNIEILHEDILKINLQKISTSYKLPTTNYKLIANLPYYITSPIIRLFLETKIPPQEMILMVQKEVAERIVARPGKMSILAISVQYYAEPKLLFEVSKEAFYPVPKVDSAVIKITPNPTILPLERGGIKGGVEEKQFFRLVRAGFCAKRKTLVNNLSTSLHLDKKLVEKKLEKLDLNSNVRAQELSLKKWKELAEIL